MKRNLIVFPALAAMMLCGMNSLAGNFSKAPARQSLKKESHIKSSTRAGQSAPLTDIITTPKGNPVNYNKNAAGTFVFNNAISMYKDDFPAMIYWADNNEVYFKNIISVFPDEYYVKGTVSGNKITLPMNQTIEYDADYDYGVNIGVLKTVPTVENGQEVYTFEYVPDIESVEFTIGNDGSVEMVLPGKPFDGETPPEYVLGIYYTDDLQFLGYSDFSQKYTKLDLELITIPAGLETQQYVYIDDYNYASVVEVARDKEYLYIKGLTEMLPEGTIRAKINGNVATVAQNQYVGVYYDQYYIFTKVLYDNPDYDETDFDTDPFIFAPDNVGFELIIDDENQTIYADKKGVYLSFHCDANDFLNSLGFFSEFVLKYQKSFEGVPSNPVNLEYTTEYSFQGFNDFFFTLSNFSTEGTLLDVSVLYYEVYVNGEPLVFQQKEIPNLQGTDVVAYPEVPFPVIYLPYEFNNNEDIFKFTYNQFDIGIYTDDVKTVGVQSIYHYNDVFTYSDVVTLNVETGETTVAPGENAVQTILDNEVVATEYYTLDGRRINNPEKGICIKVSRAANGKTSVEKVVF